MNYLIRQNYMEAFKINIHNSYKMQLYVVFHVFSTISHRRFYICEASEGA